MSMPGPAGSGGLVVDVESDLKAVATRAGARRPEERYNGCLTRARGDVIHLRDLCTAVLAAPNLLTWHS